LDSASNPERTKLNELLYPNRFGAIPLGRLRGETKLELILAMPCLPSGSVPEEHDPGFEEAITESYAIAYPDGHPSEEQIRLRVRPANDEKLRRCVALGYVVIIDGDRNWRKTGHALVMDMDEGRDRHPWFVLASEWPNDSGDVPYDGDDKIYAEKRVKRNDANVHGVFPGEKNRTLIARLRHYVERSDSSKPFLKQFGANFYFDLDSFGRGTMQSQSHWGPDLVSVMDWLEDPETHEEVYNTEDGHECIRFDPETQSYTYPNHVEATTQDPAGFEAKPICS